MPTSRNVPAYSVRHLTSSWVVLKTLVSPTEVDCYFFLRIQVESGMEIRVLSAEGSGWLRLRDADLVRHSSTHALSQE